MSARAMPARGLAPRLLPASGARDGAGIARAEVARAVFWMTMAAILLQLTVSANLLQVAGIPYNTNGGLPLEKFHPATYLTVATAILLALRSRPVMPALMLDIARAPHFPAAFAAMIACAIYAVFSTGMSGTAVYVESYASAALLGFVLEQQSKADLRRYAYAMLAVLTMNALLCIGETWLQKVLVPVMLTNPEGYVTELPILNSEFRGLALYENPLGGAMITMMGVFLCLATDLRPALKACILGPLLVALITFGGRTAMLVTYSILMGLAAWTVVGRLAKRRMDGRMLAVALICAILIPTVLAGILFGTSLGDRIAGKFYVDDSATVRVVQWAVLGIMDIHDWLFGMDSARLNAGLLQIGLDPPYNDIENFWLLVFVSLGSVGFVVWLSGLGMLLRRLWLAPGKYGRLILLSVLVVASGSNSLGRKSNILFLCVASVMISAAFADERQAPAPRFSASRLMASRSRIS